MKKTKEYKISCVLFIVCIISMCLSAVTSLFGRIDTSLDNMFMYLGFALLCLGFVFLKKAKDKNDSQDE